MTGGLKLKKMKILVEILLAIPFLLMVWFVIYVTETLKEALIALVCITLKVCFIVSCIYGGVYLLNR